MLTPTLIHLAECDSTNRQLLLLAGAEAAEGTVLLAERQTAGRGRLGRQWHTFSGQSLAMSLLLRPKVAVERVSQLSLLAAVAVQRVLAGYSSEIGIKWPNDLLWQGRKLCGILTEMRTERGEVAAVVVGIGINLRRPAEGWPADLATPAVALDEICSESISRKALAAAVATSLFAEYGCWLEQGFAPIRDRWQQVHVASNRRVKVIDFDSEISGITIGIDDGGALLLQTESGVQRIITGDLVAVV